MNQELTKFNPGSLASINPEVIDAVVSISDDDVKWVKIAAGGFYDGDKLFAEEMRGVIFDFKPYWIRWTPGKPPEKIPFTAMDLQPEGFELRLDLKVALPSEEFIGLSLAPSSARSFSRYMRRVQSARLILSEIVTLFSVKIVTNKNAQKFALVQFDFVAEKGTAGSKTKRENQPTSDPYYEPPESQEEIEDIPF